MQITDYHFHDKDISEQTDPRSQRSSSCCRRAFCMVSTKFLLSIGTVQILKDNVWAGQAIDVFYCRYRAYSQLWTYATSVMAVPRLNRGDILTNWHHLQWEMITKILVRTRTSVSMRLSRSHAYGVIGCTLFGLSHGYTFFSTQMFLATIFPGLHTSEPDKSLYTTPDAQPPQPTVC